MPVEFTPIFGWNINKNMLKSTNASLIFMSCSLWLLFANFLYLHPLYYLWNSFGWENILYRFVPFAAARAIWPIYLNYHEDVFYLFRFLLFTYIKLIFELANSPLSPHKLKESTTLFETLSDRVLII